MPLELIAIFILLCVGVYYGSLLDARKSTESKSNGLPALAIGFVGFLIFFAIGRSFAVFFLFVAFLIMLPIFLIGLGLSLGRLSVSLRGQRPAYIAIVTTAFFWPLLPGYYLATQFIESKKREAIVAQELADFQLTNITGRLGRHPITLPASPQINAYYTCFFPGRADASECRSVFSHHAGLRYQTQDIAVFHRLIFVPKSESCEKSCLTFKALAKWCETRPKLAFTEWCQQQPTHHLRFTYDENPPASDGDGWQPVSGVDIAGIDIKCIRSTKQQTCRAIFEIARNVEVRIWMKDVSDDALATEVIAMRAYAKRLWDAMQRH